MDLAKAKIARAIMLAGVTVAAIFAAYARD
jgi:hypothetical protein